MKRTPKIIFYDPRSYWLEKGQYPVQEGRRHERQNPMVKDTIKYLDFKTVYEVGAGDGRVSTIILNNRKLERFLCCDISPPRVEMFEKNVTKKFPNAQIFEGDFLEHHTTEKFDLVIEAETLLHVKPKQIKEAVKKMFDMSKKYVVIIDFLPDYEPETLAYYNYAHDFPTIIKDLGYKPIIKRVDKKTVIIQVYKGTKLFNGV